MGSVGKKYRCPLCGRTGNGGYSPDWIGFPVCTEGSWNCLDKITDGKLLAADIVGIALGKIIGGARAFENFPGAAMKGKSELLRSIACSLVYDTRDELDAMVQTALESPQPKRRRRQ